MGGPLAALGLALLLVACQSAAWCGSRDSAASLQDDAQEPLLRVADDARAHGDPATAITLYRRLYDKRPSDTVPLARLGSTLAEVKAYSDAAAVYRVALALAPGDPDLHRGLAVVLLSLGQAEPAIAELEAALAKRGDDPHLFKALGVAQDFMGRHDLAQQAYRDGLRLAPDDAGLRNDYGLSLALSGEYDAAAQTLLQIAGAPGALTRYRLNLALVYGLAGDDEKSAAIARSALDEAAVRNNLSYYAVLRGMDDKARVAAIMGSQAGDTFAGASRPSAEPGPDPWRADAPPGETFQQ